MSNSKQIKHKLMLIIYDLIVAISCCFLIFYLYLNVTGNIITIKDSIIKSVIFVIIVFTIRIYYKLYNQVWRYAEVNSYLKLMFSDGLATIIFYGLDRLVLQSLFHIKRLSFANTVSLFSIDLLLVLAMRIGYRYAFKYGNNVTKLGKILSFILNVFSFGTVRVSNNTQNAKTPIAILGAGRVGAALAQDLNNNVNSKYLPVMFIDIDNTKIGREIDNIHIYSEDISKEDLIKNGVEEVIFATPHMDINKRKSLYEKFNGYGLKVKVYDYPLVESDNGKKTLREFDIEDLLFRKPVLVVDNLTKNYYKNKVVLITGGGGSIGSEMARQVAKMSPKQLILFDIYENGVYDVQTEMRLAYKDKLDLRIEIGSVCDKTALEKVFSTYRPQLVIHAAAHKHVPLMEHNCIEAIKNNVFGTLATVEISEKFGVERFIMVSTDKAVNPTNVMGATKRMCEMIVKSHAEYTKSKTTFSMTRFGNVLNSAGSVIPLFKKQLAKGGPLTITDFRIIRYFMTIPEASQLVLKSGAMAKNGELFVLDMGKPIKILDLAESIIKLSGLTPYKDIDIVETGLRPGEKLYEELLIKTDSLDKTKDKLIFIEHDQPLTTRELNKKLKALEKVIEKNDNQEAKQTLKLCVPTYKDPNEINTKIA